MVTSRRDKMIEDNIGLVHSIAKRFKGRGEDYDDLYQAGCVGLIKAVDNFDESKGFLFSTYAVPVIMGEIRRLFRDGGAVKVSRSLKEKSIKVQAIREKFIKKELREPTVSELSELCGIETEELSEVLNVINPVVSLSCTTEDGDETIDIPVDDTDQLFDRLSVHQAIRDLSNDELLLIKYRFYEGKTQCETAKLLGISQVQVSRREKQLLAKLRTRLE
ncbi:sigma-70 family RNA polymerase sigma factor [uncultured Eubacterium sp.]|uniref:sigma-70 family RNA polymerase sigma factor n=1 Tax=uncultured Eubacterium sp. TaxID=165185 RepID=UPI0025E84AC5|nr:sigma-70 family RNA polymerase sigma factor [uncultured Eubacterium sp.]